MSSRRERKVVTVLFCDLVGFTSQAEALDPEDVEAILRPYHERVRMELERHGGTVEKFIGDAVMAVFGAPVAHEDDPERAVRAALAIREFAVEGGLELRVGITTGEALVRLDAQPGAGEGMASGDVVNTAARLQSAAPVNGVIVDETTYRATRWAIDYDEGGSIEAKGKAQPVPVWRATTAHARLGVDVAHDARSDLVGRERELGVLRGAFERARHERVPQLVTLVGVPGLGKSRLVYELSCIADADPELVTWRQGRCLAYGDGVTLWALGEIVKAQAGIVEQDAPERVLEKVTVAVADALGGSGDEEWVLSHLRPLVGLEGGPELSRDRRSEAFAAWRRFLEGMAEQRALVLGFEDLHWADETLLDFVDELCEWVTDAPLLVLATARPELLERRPNWGGGKLNATTLALAPLSNEETAQLLAGALGTPVLAAETQAVLLDRAGGNPLYAEQFADLYLERGSTDELSLPETLQGLIAARLDGLAAVEKTLLQDAAVIGKVFWASAVQGEPDEMRSTLHALERKGFVRRQRRSSVEGESELAFAHALVRDVAYGQIPRGERAAKHRRVAEWIESLGRPEDHAEMRAYHWRSALQLARAAGGDGADLVGPARRALADAGDRAATLNGHAVAASYYAQALDLWPETDARRPELVFRHARALYYAYDDAREDALATARDALLAAGENDLAAEAESFLTLVMWYRGQGEATMEHLARANELIGDAISPAAARVHAVSARTLLLSDEIEASLPRARAAYDIADHLGLDEVAAHALATIGMARCYLDDVAGMEDMERAYERAWQAGSPVAAPILVNIGVQSVIRGDFARAETLWREGLELAERFGDHQSSTFTRANCAWMDYMRGRWDDALRDADDFIARCEAGAPHAQEQNMRLVRAGIREGRADARGALEDHLRAVELARGSTDAGHLGTALALLARYFARAGKHEEARAAALEAIPALYTGLHGGFAALAPYAGELAITSEFRHAVEASPRPRSSPWRELMLRSLDGDFLGAADRLEAFGAPMLEADMRAHAGASLLRAGRRSEGEAQLEQALAFFRSVHARAFVERAEALLAGDQSASA